MAGDWLSRSSDLPETCAFRAIQFSIHGGGVLVEEEPSQLAEHSLASGGLLSMISPASDTFK